jgi:hypothetical protein
VSARRRCAEYVKASGDSVDSGFHPSAAWDCHHNTTMPVADLLRRYAAETLFPEAWGGFRCSVCGSRHVDVRPNWAAKPTRRSRDKSIFNL